MPQTDKKSPFSWYSAAPPPIADVSEALREAKRAYERSDDLSARVEALCAAEALFARLVGKLDDSLIAEFGDLSLNQVRTRLGKLRRRLDPDRAHWHRLQSKARNAARQLTAAAQDGLLKLATDAALARPFGERRRRNWWRRASDFPQSPSGMAATEHKVAASNGGVGAPSDAAPVDPLASKPSSNGNGHGGGPSDSNEKKPGNPAQSAGSASPPPVHVLEALEECISLVPVVEGGIDALQGKQSAGAPRPSWKLFVFPTTAILAGLLLVVALGGLRDEAIDVDLTGHARVASRAARQSGQWLDSADTSLRHLKDLLAVDSGVMARLQQRAEIALMRRQDRDSTRWWQHHIVNDLIAAHGLNATAIDALSRVGQVAHTTMRAYDPEVTVAVTHAMALSEVAATAGKKAIDAADSTSFTAFERHFTVYRNALVAQAAALSAASTIPQLPGIAPSRSERFLADAFVGKTPSEFAVKLFYAVAFVLMGGGALFILGRVSGVIDGKSTIESMIDASAKDAPRTASTVWPLLAPLGLVTGLVGGYSLAGPVNRDIERDASPTHHVQATVAPDSLSLSSLNAALGELTKSQSALATRLSQIDTTLAAIRAVAR